MEPLASHADAEVYHADWRDLLTVVHTRGGCDALIVDTPYSERTHSGHDDGAVSANRVAHFASTTKGRECDRRYAARPSARREVHRQPLTYAAWGASDVAAFVAGWIPLVRGWFVTITDHALAPVWATALEVSGRYVFAPLPWVAPGSRVRLLGDGPSAWTCWIVVARPRTADAAKWGTLPGAYVQPEGQCSHAARGEVIGGKPLWLMESLVRDYSRAGDLIVDPCCGAGTTLVAAQRNARRSIGGDLMREHAELSAKRISRPAQQPLFGGL